MFQEAKPDIVAEKMVLSGIMHHGADAYFDVCDILSVDAFTENTHLAIYRCLKNIFDKEQANKADVGSIVSTSIELGYKEMFDNKSEIQFLRALQNFGNSVELESIRRHAAKIQKIYIANYLQKAAIETIKDLGEISGTETIDVIFGKAEERIFEAIGKLCGSEEAGTKKIGEGISNFVQNLVDNPNPIYGIPTPFPIYNKHIGGGLIRKELDIICSRAKVGKSGLLDNVAIYVANSNIPVLNIDTELSQEQHWIRMLACISGVSMEKIKTGEFSKNPAELKLIRDAEEKIKSMPYYYECVGGKTFEDIVSIMRRWISKYVGKDENGKTKDCLILYDYIKLLNEDGLSGNMAEHQKLGFIVTSLKNFLIRYDVPCLAFAQLNRDGIDKNSTDAVAGSDRILMYCSSLSFLKPKETEEIADAGGIKYGNRKLFCVASRNGPGTDGDDYINIIFNKDICRMTEGQLKSELQSEKQEKEGFEIDDDSDPLDE